MTDPDRPLTHEGVAALIDARLGQLTAAGAPQSPETAVLRSARWLLQVGAAQRYDLAARIAALDVPARPLPLTASDQDRCRRAVNYLAAEGFDGGGEDTIGRRFHCALAAGRLTATAYVAAWLQLPTACWHSAPAADGHGWEVCTP
jgi:hypothetical protein